MIFFKLEGYTPLQGGFISEELAIDLIKQLEVGLREHRAHPICAHCQIFPATHLIAFGGSDLAYCDQCCRFKRDRVDCPDSIPIPPVTSNSESVTSNSESGAVAPVPPFIAEKHARYCRKCFSRVWKDCLTCYICGAPRTW